METISVQAVISARDNGYSKAMQQAIAQSEALEKTSERAGESIKNIAAGTVVGKAVTKAFGMITASIDSAISRLDTLNNYPKVMTSLGYTAGDAQKSIDRLQKGIEGLPTTLTDIVSNTQQLTTSLGDLEKGTQTAIALNDMFLAGGQGGEAASRALAQYNQALAKGKPDMQDWRSMLQIIPGQLDQVAKSMLGATAGQSDLYDALQKGTITMDDLNAQIIKLDQEGGQGFASFHDQAMAATDGIQTGVSNLQSAVTRGVANVIDAIDKAAHNSGLPTISEGLASAKQGVNNFFNAAADLAGKITKVVAPAIKFLIDNIDNAVVAVGSVVAGITALKVIDSVKSKIDSFKSKINNIKKSFQDYNDVLKEYGSISNARDAAEESSAKALEARKTAEEAAKNVSKERQKVEEAEIDLDNAKRAATIAGTNADEAQLAIDQAQNGVISAQNGLKNALTASTHAEATAEELEAAATRDAEAAQRGMNAAIQANPLTLFITVITTTISALSMLAAAFGGLSEEEKKARDEQREFIDSANETANTVHDAAASIEKQKESYAETRAQTSALVDEIAALNEADKEDIESKGKLKKAVAKLNAQVDDLNLTYDEETGKIKGTVEALREKVEAALDIKQAEKVEEDYLTALENEQKLKDDLTRAEEDLKKAKEGTLATQKKEMEWYDLAAASVSGGLYEQLQATKAYGEANKEVKDTIQNLNQAIEENAQIREENADQMVELEEKKAEAARKEAEAEAEAARQAMMAEVEHRVRNTKILANAIAEKQQLLDESLATDNVRLDLMTQKNQETVAELQNIWQGYVDKATDMFNTLSDEQTVSVDQMIANLAKNQQVINDWGNNMQSIRDRMETMDIPAPVREGLEQMLAQLQEAGPEQAGAVAAIAAADDKQLKALGKKFSTAGETAWEGLYKSSSEGAKKNLDQVKSAVTDIEETLDKAIADANFSELGDDIVKGLAEGIGADDLALKAAKEMAKHTEDAARTQLDSHSPSGVFKDIGRDVDTGLQMGLTTNKNLPINMIRAIGQQLISTARSALAGMQSVGMYAMQGFVNGMRSMAGAVYATAASIANSAKASIESALKVGSPSKVMKQIGYWTGKGLALGIEGTDKLVEKASTKLASIAAGISIPDISSMFTGGTYEMAFAGGFSIGMEDLRSEVRELRSAIMSQPIQVSSEIKMDGRAVAKGTAVYDREESNRLSKLSSQLGGIK